MPIGWLSEWEKGREAAVHACVQLSSGGDAKGPEVLQMATGRCTCYPQNAPALHIAAHELEARVTVLAVVTNPSSRTCRQHEVEALGRGEQEGGGRCGCHWACVCSDDGDVMPLHAQPQRPRGGATDGAHAISPPTLHSEDCGAASGTKRLAIHLQVEGRGVVGGGGC